MADDQRAVGAAGDGEQSCARVKEPVGFSADPTATPRIKGGMMVSGDYFHVLGVEPRLGRAFREDEDPMPICAFPERLPY